MLIDSQRRFTFGKHKGLTVRDVAHDEPTYIGWCWNNIEGFKKLLTDDEISYWEHRAALERRLEIAAYEERKSRRRDFDEWAEGCFDIGDYNLF